MTDLAADDISCYVGFMEIQKLGGNPGFKFPLILGIQQFDIPALLGESLSSSVVDLMNRVEIYDDLITVWGPGQEFLLQYIPTHEPIWETCYEGWEENKIFAVEFRVRSKLVKNKDKFVKTRVVPDSSFATGKMEFSKKRKIDGLLFSVAGVWNGRKEEWHAKPTCKKEIFFKELIG